MYSQNNSKMKQHHISCQWQHWSHLSNSHETHNFGFWFSLFFPFFSFFLFFILYFTQSLIGPHNLWRPIYWEDCLHWLVYVLLKSPDFFTCKEHENTTHWFLECGGVLWPSYELQRLGSNWLIKRALTRKWFGDTRGQSCKETWYRYLTGRS